MSDVIANGLVIAMCMIAVGFLGHWLGWENGFRDGRKVYGIFEEQRIALTMARLRERASKDGDAYVYAWLSAQPEVQEFDAELREKAGTL